MHKLVMLLAIFSAGLFGQQNDLSFWTRSTAGSTSSIPWYMHFGDKVVVDVRHNYDANDTLGACVGKKVGSGALSVVPEACWYSGKIDGLGPEILVLGDNKKISFFSQNQFVYDGHGRDSFLYHWGDLQFKTNKRFWLGVDWQAFKPTDASAPTVVDLGPALKVMVGSAYFRIWPCWAVDPKNPVRRGDPTIFFGLGRTW